MSFSRVGPNQTIERGQFRLAKSPQGKMPFSRRFAYVLLQFSPPRTPQQLLPKRRRSGAKPCAAQRRRRDITAATL